MREKFYKIFTHDFRSPLQGGDPVWDGSMPFTLPTVKLDTSDEECSEGWDFTDDLAKGFKIAGMWPNGRPSCVAIIEPGEDAIQRGDKWRASGGILKRFATEVEIAQGIEKFSEVFGKFKPEMTSEQIAWRHALGRPENDKAAVVEALEKTIAHRGLKWTLKEYGDAWDARAARAAWDAWDARDARAARAARAAWAAWAARAARAAWDAWDARAARAAWDAWDARAALVVFFAAKQGWIKDSADLLTIGLRDAYAHGLEIAIPTEKNTLGWSMKP